MKQGIKLHTINTNKFKTNLIAMFLSIPLTRENVTKNSLLVSVLRRGCEQFKTQEEISKKLEEMYGAEFNCGLDKLGKNHVLKFYIESINDEFLPQNGENMLKQSIEILSEIVFNPLTQNGEFNEEYINQEKENVNKKEELPKNNFKKQITNINFNPYENEINPEQSKESGPFAPSSYGHPCFFFSISIILLIFSIFKPIIIK